MDNSKMPQVGDLIKTDTGAVGYVKRTNNDNLYIGIHWNAGWGIDWWDEANLIDMFGGKNGWTLIKNADL